MSTARKLFGKKLRQLRLQRNLSQERLAEMADLHPNYISRLERGQQNVGLDAIVQLAKALKIAPEELIRGVG